MGDYTLSHMRIRECIGTYCIYAFSRLLRIRVIIVYISCDVGQLVAYPYSLGLPEPQVQDEQEYSNPRPFNFYQQGKIGGCYKPMFCICPESNLFLMTSL